MINWRVSREQRVNERRLALLEEKEFPTNAEAAEIVYLLMLELELTEKKINYILKKLEYIDTKGRSKLMKSLEEVTDILSRYKSNQLTTCDI